MSSAWRSIQATGSLSGALVADFLNGAGVEPVDMGVLGFEALELAAEVIALAAVALEEAKGVELVVGLPDPQFGLFAFCELAFGVAGEDPSSARACRAGKSSSARQTRSCSSRSSVVVSARACACSGSSEARVWARLGCPGGGQSG